MPSIDEIKKVEVFNAQAENVRALIQTRKHINRTINNSLRKGDHIAAEIHTKLLALTFCAWVEADFSKLIHTPYGFSLSEIEKIKTAYKSNLGKGWNKCLQLGLDRISGTQRPDHIQAIQERLSDIINQHVIEPSQIRNRIAHGQWKIALNSDQTAKNQDITKNIKNLDTTVVNDWFEIHKHLSLTIELLIESPHKAFHHAYIAQMENLEKFLITAQSHSLEEKMKRINKKPIIHLKDR